MTNFCFACIVFTLLLFSTVACGSSLDDDKETCKDLCESCGGSGSFLNDNCECHTHNEELETTECIEDIREKAAGQNITLINIRHDILGRAARCCPNTSRLRLSDILRVAKYFMNDGPEVGARILGNHRNFESGISGSSDCQRCLDDDDDPPIELVMPEEESIDSFLGAPAPSVEYILGPQTCTIQNPYPYNNINALNTPSIDQIQSPHNYYRSLVVPPTSLHDCSHDPLPALLAHPYPIAQVTPITAQVHLSHHLQHGFIEPSLTHLPSSNYPQYPLIRVPHQSIAKSHMGGTYRNSIRNPSFLLPSISQASSSGARSHQMNRPRISSLRRPIVQPFYTLPSPISQMGYSPQANNPVWSYAMPNTNMYQGMHQQAMPYGDSTTFGGDNYAGESLLGAANPNAGESNNNNGERTTLNMNGQQSAQKSTKIEQPPLSSQPPGITGSPDQSPSALQSSLAPSLDSTLLRNIPNTIKRNLPPALRYKQMNKRELKIKGA